MNLILVSIWNKDIVCTQITDYSVLLIDVKHVQHTAINWKRILGLKQDIKHLVDPQKAFDCVYER